MSEWARGYKDPRWQRVRLQIMERDKWTCRWCGSSEATLQVHHGYYRKEAKGPWDYCECSLWTLCDTCHERATEQMREIRYRLAHMHPKAILGLSERVYGAWADQANKKEKP